MASQLAFAIVALPVIVAGWRVVTSDDLLRASLWLVVVLVGMAPLFLLLAAEFVAVVQVLVYVGAVVVLFLFGIMLTHSPMGRSEHHDHWRRWPGAVLALALFLALRSAFVNAFGQDKVVPEEIGRTAGVGIALLQGQVIAFEAVSVLLLAALIGAIVLARRD